MILNVLRGGNSYTANVWKQERFVLHANSQTGQLLVWTNLQGSANAPIAKYKVGSDNYAYIDMTDYVRAYPNVTTIYVYDVSSVVSSVSVSVKGLINPQNVNIPTHPLMANGALIIPPRMFYAGQNYDEDDAEFYATSGTWNVTGGATMAVNKRNIGQMYDDFVLSDGTRSLKYRRRKFICGVEYIKVKWVSFTGIEREHWFEVSKRKTETANAYELLTLDGDFNTIKGRLDGFTLRLDRLNTYDLWYYSDVMQSSKVEVSRDGGYTDAWRQVQITDKAITLPDGEAGTNGVLEIAVNYREYDAVAM